MVTLKASAWLAAFFAATLSARAQDGAVNLTGIVADASGKPLAGARIRLLDRRLETLTDTAGHYALSAPATTLVAPGKERSFRGGNGPNGYGRAGFAPSGPAPEWMGGELAFTVGNAPAHVGITLHTLSGKLAGRIAGADLEPGRYLITPSLPGAEARIYLARVRIGNSVWTLKLPGLHPGAQGAPLRMLPGLGYGNSGAAYSASVNPAAATGGEAAAGTGGEAAAGNGSEAAAKSGEALAKDSLDVLAIGYARGIRGLAVLNGVQDFKLDPLQYTAVPYKTGTLSAYEKRMTTLDVHVPAGPMKKWPVIVHLHGGGLQEGDSEEGWSAADKNDFVRKLWEQGYLLVCPNYRLGIDPDLPNGGAPRGKWPDYLRDAAASIAWARRNVEAYGGDPDNFFVMGYSAGAWLAVMLALDTAWYREAGFDGNQVSGYIPLSTHMTTYFEYAIEQNIPDTGLSIGAALSHIGKLDVPMHLFVGGNEGRRITDNRNFAEKMMAAGSKDVRVSVMPGRDHQQIVETIGNATDETRILILEFLKEYSRN